MTKLLNLLGGCCCLWAVWVAVTADFRAMPQMRPALSSYGSSQQVVSPPVGASIAIAKDGR